MNKKTGVEEPYASKYFEFDLSAPNFTERKDDIFLLVQELTEKADEVIWFFSHDKLQDQTTPQQ